DLTGALAGSLRGAQTSVPRRACGTTGFATFRSIYINYYYCDKARGLEPDAVALLGDRITAPLGAGSSNTGGE
ncbi:MAG: hypothetical protein WA230_20260, partial [Xanthobacteraceae bacterium]